MTVYEEIFEVIKARKAQETHLKSHTPAIFLTRA